MACHSFPPSAEQMTPRTRSLVYIYWLHPISQNKNKFNSLAVSEQVTMSGSGRRNRRKAPKSNAPVRRVRRAKPEGVTLCIDSGAYDIIFSDHRGVNKIEICCMPYSPFIESVHAVSSTRYMHNSQPQYLTLACR